MADAITVTFTDGKRQTYSTGTTLLQIAREAFDNFSTPIVAARVNNALQDLQTELEKDAQVQFLDLTSEDGMKVFQRSITFVLIAAAHDLFPEGELTVEHSLSKGLYCELHIGREINAADVAALQARMRDLVQQNIPIIRKRLPLHAAIELFEKSGQVEKVRLLKQLDRSVVSIYYLNELYDYFYGTMAPATGMLANFELVFFPPGVILRFPQKEKPEQLPGFRPEPKLAEVFLEAEQWGQILCCGYVGALNETVEREGPEDLVRVAEALHEKKIAQIADHIADHRKEVRLILVAGPSSSGKTTFAQRLNVQLRVNGLRPVPISLDDYFVDRGRTPRNVNGEFDFEDIEAIDLEAFNEDLTRLLEGAEVDLPTYNFITGKREYRGRKIRIQKDQPLIIEGIHGLNERLTASIPRCQKAKIYISALTQLSIDNHNRIPTTDTRLIRRIVRDHQFRAHPAYRTLALWSSVRAGEERNIFPFQEEADIMFNSALIYELAVLKRYAEPLLVAISPDQKEFAEAQRLLDFLAYFKSIDETEIPPNSILREFIGKSCFYPEQKP